MKEKARVLIVEDKENYQETLKTIIKPFNYKVEVATTLEESVSKLNRFLFILALVDLRLVDSEPKNKDGLRVLEYINKLGEGTKAIMLTQYGKIIDSSEAFRKHDVFDFIDKNDTDIHSIRAVIKKAEGAFNVDFMRPSQHPISIQRLIMGNDAKILLTKIGHDSEELELFLKRLFYGLHPILPDKSKAVIGQIEGTNKIVEARFWSKMLGKPIVAIIGKYEELLSIMQKIDETSASSEMIKRGSKLKEVFDEKSFPHFGGVVYELTKAKFEDFDAPVISI